MIFRDCRAAAIVLLSVSAAIACSSSRRDSAGGTGGGGTGGMAGNPGSSTGGAGGVGPTPGTGGGATAGAAGSSITGTGGNSPLDAAADSACTDTVMLSVVAPNVLLLLDRSGSMLNDIDDLSCPGGCGDASKWAMLTAAINQVVAETQADINWGLKFFANTSGCQVNAGVTVAPGRNAAASIATAIAATLPQSSTPTAMAEASAGAYLSTLQGSSPSYILLATDGLPTCGPASGAGGATGSTSGTDDANTIASVSAVAQMGFRTFVVGVATAGTSADTTLGAMAVAGGVPRSATPPYYPITSASEFASTLRAIGDMTTAGCRLEAPGRPDLRGAVTLTIDGISAPRGTTDGWDVEPAGNAILFHGALCTVLEDSVTRNVVLQLACGAGGG